MMISQTVWFRTLITLLITSIIWTSACWAKETAAKDGPPLEPTTTKESDVPIDELELLIKPLTKDELLIEADGWLKLVKSKVEEVSAAEIAVKQKNREIKKAKELQKEVEEAKETLDEVKEAAETSQNDKTGKAAKQAVTAAKKAQEVAERVAKKIEEAQAIAQKISQDETVKKALDSTGVTDSVVDKYSISEGTLEIAQEAKNATAKVTRAVKETQTLAVEGQYAEKVRNAEEVATRAGDAQQALHATSEAVKADVKKTTETLAKKLVDPEKLEQINIQAETTVNTDAKIKSQILDVVAGLRAERTALIDRFNVVLDELSTKLGKTPECKDNELVVP